MTSQPTPRAQVFITPLSGDNVLNVGEIFPCEELRRRILSLFWRDCCGILPLSRAPAPILELSDHSGPREGAGSRVRAWWILNDGMVEEREGPYADRLDLFFGAKGEDAQLWPRYLFTMREEPFGVELTFQERAGVHRTTRIVLELQPDGWVRVTERLAGSGSSGASQEPGNEPEGHFDLGPKRSS
jgi:hypothetical protein